MEISEIRKEKLSVTPVGELEANLAEMAAEILGYSAVEAKREAEYVQAMPKLKSALANLEIEILNPNDVARYKMEKRHAAECRLLTERSEREPQLFWQEREIAKYRKPIPDFVLNKAIQIKKEIPECTLNIEELDENPDPFLLVKIGYSEEYYVEVWSEPRFERR